MEDNLFNDWGVCLVDPTINSSTRGEDATLPSDRDQTYQIYRNKVQQITNQMYTLLRVESCGSTVNTLALHQASEGDTKSCVYAVGTYIAGDGELLNELSLSSRQLDNNGLVLPLKRESATPAQMKNCVPLPYYIPSGTDEDDFRKSEGCLKIEEDGIGCLHHYEDRCLLSLHLMLLTRRIHNDPIRVILLEPMLAGCGGILSLRCYKILARLAKTHGFVFVLDEVLTFGRLGYKHGLYCIEHFPPEMHQYITLITIGKWMGNAAILKRVRSGELGPPETVNFFQRVVSTKINITKTLKTWDSVFSRIEFTSAWRELVLDYIGVINVKKKNRSLREERELHWGDGLLIFVAGKMRNMRAATSGLHSRFLPKINSDFANVRKILTSKKGSFETIKGWDRASINLDLVSTILGYSCPQLILLWPIRYQIAFKVCKKFQEMGIHPRDSLGRAHNEKKQSAYDLSLDGLISIIKGSGVGAGRLTDARIRSITTRVINQAKIDKEVDFDDPDERAMQSDILLHTQTGFQRRIVWRAGPSMVYWQQLLDDEADESNNPLICTCETCLLSHASVGTKKRKKGNATDVPPKKKVSRNPNVAQADSSSVRSPELSMYEDSSECQSLETQGSERGFCSGDGKPSAK